MKSKIILITGGTSGIGYSLVNQLHKNNQVIVCSKNKVKIKECQEKFENVNFIQADITNISDIENIKFFINQKYGYLDVLINNAGIANSANLSDENEPLNFDDIDVNFKGTVQVTSAMLPLIKKSKNNPVIIILSSILAKIPYYELPIYSASKAALHSYSISLRKKIKPIRVIEVLPPMVNTTMTSTLETNKKMEAKKVAEIIIKAIEKGNIEVYPGIAKMANVISKISFKRISSIINSN